MKNSLIKEFDHNSIQGLIFDLDGTLVDTMPTIVTSVGKGLQRRGVKFTSAEIGKNLFKNLYGAPLPKGIRMVPTLMYRLARIAGLGRFRSISFTIEATKRLSRAYDYAELFPGTIQLLEALRDRSKTLGLVSMGSRRGIMKILNRTGIREYFSIIISRDEVQRQKPDPEGYLMVQQSMGIPPERIAVVGDMPTDILAAKRARMPSIAVTTGLASAEWFQEPATPDFIIGSLEEISECL
ncbi:MAG: HAD family hydrolase [Candidatus Hodarchaeota archaeon]